MKTYYPNTNNLRQAIINLRLRSQDPFAQVDTVLHYEPKEIDGLPVVGTNSNYAIIDSTLTPQQIEELLSVPQTVEESDGLTNYIAVTNQVRDDFSDVILQLQNFQTNASPSNGQVVTAVKFQAKVIERLLKLFKVQVAGQMSGQAQSKIK